MFVHHKLFVLAVLGASAMSALAQGHAVSRGQVRADAAAAVASGQIPRGELPFGDVSSKGVGAVSRADVRAQAVAAVAAGEIGRGEVSFVLPSFESTRTRAEVGAETRMAMRLGLLPRGEAPAREASASELELVRLAGERAREAASPLASR